MTTDQRDGPTQYSETPLYATPIAQTADALDAERYRWLSYQTTVRFGDGNEFIMQNDMTMEELDAAIDSVIAERHAAIAAIQRENK